MTKGRRFYSKKHGGTISYSYGSSFSTKGNAENYATSFRKKGKSARIVKRYGQYTVYVRY